MQSDFSLNKYYLARCQKSVVPEKYYEPVKNYRCGVEISEASYPIFFR